LIAVPAMQLVCNSGKPKVGWDLETILICYAGA
jgi:hypothetical protein